MRCGLPPPRRGATRTARTRRAAVSRIADALAAGAARWLRELGRLGGLRPALRLGGLLLRDLATSDSWRSSFGTRIRAHGTAPPARKPREASRPFSFIRTVTVGFGIAPNLLTLLPQGEIPQREKGARGLGPIRPLPPVGNFTPP